jgi:hypothetical protein
MSDQEGYNPALKRVAIHRRSDLATAVKVFMEDMLEVYVALLLSATCHFAGMQDSL